MKNKVVLLSTLLLTFAMNGAAQTSDTYFREGANGYVILLTSDGTPTSEVRLIGPQDDLLESYTNRYYGDENVPDEVEHDGKKYQVVEFGEFQSHENFQLSQLRFGKNMRKINIFKPEFPLKDGFEVSSENKYYKTIDNILYTANGKTLLSCTPHLSPAFGTVTIPETVEVLGKEAFAYCQNITDIQLPKSLKVIDESAFEECNNMPAGLELPEGLTKIGYRAFAATEIHKLTLPSTLEVFEDIGTIFNLSSIECRATTPPSTTTESGMSWPGYYDCYKNAVLIVPRGYKEQYQQHPDWGKFLNIVEVGDEIITDCPELSDRTMQIYANNEIVTISGTKKGEIIQAYTLDGKRIASAISSGTTATIAVPKKNGEVIILKIGDKIVKIN